MHIIYIYIHVCIHKCMYIIMHFETGLTLYYLDDSSCDDYCRLLKSCICDNFVAGNNRHYIALSVCSTFLYGAFSFSHF